MRNGPFLSLKIPQPCRFFLAGCGLLFLAFPLGLPAQTLSGEQIYKKQCASCHGDKGQGVRDEYENPLEGDRSLESLTKYLDRWMPEDKPRLCSGEDAKRVAEYIYNAFYSPAAQFRNHPPRIELARLTVRQHQNTLADLIGAFRRPAKPDERTGLRAEFFNSGRGFDTRKRAVDRIDPVVRFDFGGESPAKDVGKEEYSARWSGSVFAPDTGDYEFVIDSINGVRLWINDDRNALVDRWVRSGDDRLHRGTTRLLGGRRYTLRLEIFKEKKETAAAITLKWKPPQGVEEVIPDRVLSPGKSTEIFVPATAFPPDDRSRGFVQGTRISKAWDEAATQIALETAAYAVDHLPELAGFKTGDDKTKEQIAKFCHRFVEQAFRRPLTDEQKRFFVDRHFEADADPAEAAKRIILLSLKSPRFLYPGLPSEKPDGYDAAARLALTLWDSIPDEPLLRAARENKLLQPDALAREADRMLADPRARSKTREFFHAWLHLDRLHELSKNQQRFPEFDTALVADLRTSLDLLIDEIVWSEKSDYRQLFTDDGVYLNARLAKFYSAETPDETQFRKLSLASQQRSGVLTHPLLMAGFAYDSTSSPIHRGVFVARSLLGRRLQPPKDAVTPIPPTLHPELTTRQRIAKQTQPQACISCHAMINPLGFTFENFDAAGRFQTEESGKAVDTTGHYRTPDGEMAEFSGPRDLAAYLAQSDETHTAFVERLFKEMTHQPILAYGLEIQPQLLKDFKEEGHSIRRLLARIAIRSAMATSPKKEGKDS